MGRVRALAASEHEPWCHHLVNLLCSIRAFVLIIIPSACVVALGEKVAVGCHVSCWCHARTQVPIFDVASGLVTGALCRVQPC